MQGEEGRYIGEKQGENIKILQIMLTSVIFSVTFCNIPIDKDYKVVYNRPMKERCQGDYTPLASPFSSRAMDE
jgi:hypothetical protein